MTIRLGIVMDPIASINYKKDSSLAMLWAAQDKGWDLFYMDFFHGFAPAPGRGQPTNLALFFFDFFFTWSPPSFHSRSTHESGAGFVG